jgi:hypothetical protein
MTGENGTSPKVGAAPARWRRKFTRRRQRWGAEALCLLLPGVALFGWYLAQPAPALTTGPALLIDNMLRAAGVIVLVGFAVFVAADGRVAARAAVVVSLLCLVLGASVLFSGIWSPFRDRWAMAAAAVVTTASALNIYRRRDVWTRIQGISTKVIVGALTVAAVPAFTFWTETSYLPSRNTASLELSAEAVVQSDLDGGDHWVITSTVRNPSDVRAFVIISGLLACFWANETEAALDDDEPPKHCAWLTAPFNEGSWLDPGATLTHRTPTQIHDAHQLLEVRLRVAYARADRVIQVTGSDRNATPAELGDCTAAQVWDLQPQSRLSALARRELQMMYADRASGRTFYFGADGSLVCRDPDESDDMSERGMDESQFQGLDQQLSLTESITVWVGWRRGEAAAEPTG